MKYLSKVKNVYKTKLDNKNCMQLHDNENPYLVEVQKLAKTIPNWSHFFANDDESTDLRISNWSRLEVIGEPLCSKYAWAIPDERSLGVLKHFSPLVEMGAGKGYWAKLLKNREVDIIPFDQTFGIPPKVWTTVFQGGPEKLTETFLKDRTLFLCYPDESFELSTACMQYYSGQFIIHVGELIHTGTVSGYPQAPFGRTTSSEFNVLLAEKFHCILVIEIPRFPFSNDCLTVWKRTEWVPGRLDGDNNKSNYWSSIPKAEKLTEERCISSLQHLL